MNQYNTTGWNSYLSYLPCRFHFSGWVQCHLIFWPNEIKNSSGTFKSHERHWITVGEGHYHLHFFSWIWISLFYIVKHDLDASHATTAFLLIVLLVHFFSLLKYLTQNTSYTFDIPIDLLPIADSSRSRRHGNWSSGQQISVWESQHEGQDSQALWRQLPLNLRGRARWPNFNRH